MTRVLWILLLFLLVLYLLHRPTVREVANFSKNIHLSTIEFTQTIKDKPATTKEWYTQKIPLKIHQTAFSRQMDYQTIAACLLNQNTNPEYKYCFYDENECVDYIKTHYPQYLKHYNVLNPGAYKSDLFRLLLLYREGGVYIDTKSFCINPLHTFLRPEDEIFLVRDATPDSIYQGFLCAIPGHPMLKQFIDRYVRNIENRHYGDNFWDIGGPLMCGRVLNETYNRPPRSSITPFSDGGLRIGAKVSVLKEGSELITSVDGKEIYLQRTTANYKIKSFKEILKGKKYTAAWVLGTVYKT